MDLFSTSMMMKKKKTKGRFSNEQIKSLESIFELDSKLEPSKKLQIAKELGLQPQQVVIWFQNRRARWKSKQLERDYDLLKANYDDLVARFESLKEEKHSLVMQLQMLGDDQMRNNTPEENGSCGLGLATNSTNGNVDNKEPESEPEKKPTLSREGLNPTVTSSKNENSASMEYYRDEKEPEYMSAAYEVLASHQNWRNFDSSDLFESFDQSSSSSNSQWWELWP